MRNTDVCKYKKYHAFGLIEILIAVLILSIGLLSLASMQIAAYQYIYGAYLRSQAVSQVHNMAEQVNGRSLQKVSQTKLKAWYTQNAKHLPGGHGKLDYQGTSFIIHLRWSDMRKANNQLKLLVN